MSSASCAAKPLNARMPQMLRLMLSLAIVIAVVICGIVQPSRPVTSGVRLALSICLDAVIVAPPSPPSAAPSVPPSAGTVTVTVLVLPPSNAFVASSCSGDVAAVFTVWQVEQRSAAKYLPFEALPAAPPSAPPSVVPASVPPSAVAGEGRADSGTVAHCAAVGRVANAPVSAGGVVATAGIVRR